MRDVTEPRLETELISRFDRIVWRSITGFVLLVLAVFGFVAEFAVRSSADNSADVIQSLIGLYADLRLYINYLRKKLSYKETAQVIQTVRGVGYRMEDA